MYCNVSFMFEQPVSFYVTEVETDETVDKETYEKYLSGKYIKGDNGEPVDIEEHQLEEYPDMTMQTIEPPVEHIDTPTLPEIDYMAILNKNLMKLKQEVESGSIYRLAHGELMPEIDTSKYTLEIVAMQLAGDNFNSPNVGIDIKKPLIPFYQGHDFTAGINEDNQAYISNEQVDTDTCVNGWLTVKKVLKGGV